MIDPETAVTQAMAGYTKAVASKDVDALVGLYAPEVRVFDAWGVWSYEGSGSWRGAIEGWFSSLGTERVEVSFQDTQVVVEGTIVLVSTIARYAGISAQGEALWSMQNRLTWAMRLTDHGLRVIHEHSSAPIGFEDMRTILHRDPTG